MILPYRCLLASAFNVSKCHWLNYAFRMQQLTLQHVAVSTITDGKDMRWKFSTSLAFVQLDDTGSVDRVSLVGIDSDTEKAGVGLKEIIWLDICSQVTWGNHMHHDYSYTASKKA